LSKKSFLYVLIDKLSDSKRDDKYCELKGMKNSQGLTSYQR